MGSFWDAVGFAAMMTVRDMMRESEREKHRTVDFNQRCREGIAGAMEQVGDLWKGSSA